MTTPDEILELEHIGDRAWPALERQWRDGWLLRAARGVTRRSNSATPFGPSHEPIRGKVVEVEDWFTERDLPPIFRLTPLAEPGIDSVLDARAYTDDFGADVMTRQVGDEEFLEEVHFERRITNRWLDVLSDDRDPAIMRRMLETLDDAVYAFIEEGSTEIAVGMGVVDGDWMTIFNMATLPSHQRRGAARLILHGLLGWASSRGVGNVMLQVEPDNKPALRLYESSGFVKRYDYRYRRLTTR